jgi:hypothetical protein
MSETFVLDHRRSTFELERAIEAYIPILDACYRLAQDMPYALPEGYEQTGIVQTASGVRRPDIPEMRAMAAARANPELFGLIVRETATGHLLIGIRGTLVLLDWIRDFVAVPVPYELVDDFGLVHLGFRETYQLVQASIVKVLNAVPPETRITILGHSLGGAMALMAAPDIKINGRRHHVDVCTVGAPRAGQHRFHDPFNAAITDCFRVVNPFDIATHLPSLAGFWRHVGEEIEVEGNIFDPHSLATYLAGLKDLQQPGHFGPVARAAGTNYITGAIVP